jgi:hypothetical protein
VALRHARPAWSGRDLAIAAAMLALASLVAWLNRGQDQYVGLFRRYQALARFLAGEGEAPLLTYPSWGYPWILALLPEPPWLSVVPQVLLAVVALMLVRGEMRRLELPAALVDVLCVAALPWYALASVKLADPWSAALTVIGAVALARALRQRALRFALASGVAFGLALNVRSEILVLLPGAAIVAFALAPQRIRSDARAWLLSLVVAVCLLLPWGCFRARHGAPFGITTTNSGMVLYNSLGFHGNAWGIVSNDELRTREVREAFGPGTDPASAEASRWFRERAVAAIRERPFELVRKVADNFTATLKFGFYGIEVEPLLGDEERLRFEVLKEQLKLLAGTKVNPVDVEEYRRAGLWQEPFSPRAVPARVWAAAALPIANSLLSGLYLLALLASLGWIAVAERHRLEDPFVRLAFAFVVASWGLVCLLYYEPRHANLLHVFGLVLVAIGAQRLGRWISARRGRPAPAP